MDPQFRIDGVSDGVLLAMEWASNCVFRLFECVCDVAAEGVNKASVGPAIPIPEIRTDGFNDSVNPTGARNLT
jgi:hypothetical protein